MTSSPLQINLVNNSNYQNAYAYVTGSNLDNNNELMLLSPDGKTPYYPPSPSSTCQPLGQDCSIPLGSPGTAVTICIPHMAGCRVWFSYNNKLTFLVNPGPALVEPSVTNPSDPNINTLWDFCELTYNSNECFANISHVDFVCMPISVTLTTTSGKVDHVSGLGFNGLRNVENSLIAQSRVDGMPWQNLIVKNSSGQTLRVLSPNNYCVVNGSASFAGYFEPYINQVWAYYTNNQTMNCDTQAQWNVVPGSVDGNGLLDFGNGVTFSKPSTADVFSCSTGPFAGGSPEQMCITPRIAAAFNRATLLSSTTTPDPAGPASFYQNPVCNHYSRIVHEQLLDNRGYGFPYDDVVATGGPDQCGAVYDSNPQVLTFAVGGNCASVDITTPYLPACTC